jgi:hypothetical protein
MPGEAGMHSTGRPVDAPQPIRKSPIWRHIPGMEKLSIALLRTDFFRGIQATNGSWKIAKAREGDASILILE